MKDRVKATFTFDWYVDGEYLCEIKFTDDNYMTFNQALKRSKRILSNLDDNHAMIFLTAGSLAVADVTKHGKEITANIYDHERN